MTNNFEKERQFVLDLAKKGIRTNLKLTSEQKKHIKNLLLFTIMRASSNKTVADKNFIKLVNKIFKTFLVQILKDNLDDDDDEDWSTAISVELNKIIASDNLKKLAEFHEIFTPSQIFSFLKKYTKGVSQRDLIERILAARNGKSNYRETPEETKKRKRNQREYALMLERQRMMTRGAKTR